VLVETQSFLVVLCTVFFSCLRHNVDSFLKVDITQLCSLSSMLQKSQIQTILHNSSFIYHHLLTSCTISPLLLPRAGSSNLLHECWNSLSHTTWQCKGFTVGPANLEATAPFKFFVMKSEQCCILYVVYVVFWCKTNRVKTAVKKIVIQRVTDVKFEMNSSNVTQCFIIDARTCVIKFGHMR